MAAGQGPIRIGNVRVSRGEWRAGILGTEVWPKIFEQNAKTWTDLGGCEITKKKMGEPACPDARFNFFPYAQDAILEYPDVDDSGVVTPHTFGSVDATKLPEEMRFPYLRRTQIELRPTLIMFEVTGHVMLGVYFGNKVQARKVPELHIINTWSMGGTQQASDVATLQDFTKTKMIVVDIAQTLEDGRYIKKIDLQAGEKIGFCPLWVSILARAVIDRIEDLSNAVRTDIGTQAPGARASKIYADIYTRLLGEKAAIEAHVKKQMKDIQCDEMAAAVAAIKLAKKAAITGKGRKTYRKRKPSPRTRKRRAVYSRKPLYK